MDIQIKIQPNHTFALTDSNTTLALSYKGFGGKDKVISLGELGLAEILNSLMVSLKGSTNQDVVKVFFQTTGTENALLIISAYCEDLFLEYWKNTVSFLKLTGQGFSLRHTLSFISDSKSTLTHFRGNTLVEKMFQICKDFEFITHEELEEAMINSSSSKTPNEYQIIERDDIRIAFSSFIGNSYAFDINGYKVSFCTNRVITKVSTKFVYDACTAIRNAVQLGEDISPFTKQYGGSFVFRLMYAVCEQEAYNYFMKIAQEITEERRKIEPLKIIEELNYSCGTKDELNKDFICNILGILENAQNKQATALIAGNIKELKKDDHWAMYYADANAAYLRMMDFTKVISISLRSELVIFLRELFGDDIISEDCRNAVSQAFRYYNALLIPLNDLAGLRILSVKNLENRHVRAIISYMSKELKNSVNKIVETLFYLRRMYAFFAFDDTEKESPFERISTFSRINALHCVQPASSMSLDTISANYDRLPNYIVLADKLLRAIEGRPRDICQLPVSALIPLDGNGKYAIKYTSSKSLKPVTTEITDWLAQEIIAYAACTEDIRTELGTDILLVYRSPDRKGSIKQPKILNANKYAYYTNKILKENGTQTIHGKGETCTARQIRSESGRRRFAEGQTATEVACALGNSPQISFKHYHELSNRDKANLHKSFNEKSMSYLNSTLLEVPEKNIYPVNTPMFGTCSCLSPCANHNLCIECRSRITRME